MRVLWDPNKAKSNYQKQGVRFSDAEYVLYDPLALTLEDERAEGEQRFVTIGSDSTNQVIVIVFAYHDADIRLISARRATKKEKKDYEKGI